MSRKKIPSKKALEEVLRELDGNMAAAARRFHCHRSLVWQHVNKDPALCQVVEDLSEGFTDEAESQLFKLIREGQPAAVIFYLKTKGRDRGYSERLELLPLRQQSIEVDLGTDRENNQAETIDPDATAIALLEQ